MLTFWNTLLDILNAYNAIKRASLVAQAVKILSAVQETCIQSLGRKDLLEEGMATLSNILAWRIPMGRGTWLATVHGAAESDKTEQLSNNAMKAVFLLPVSQAIGLRHSPALGYVFLERDSELRIY